MLYPSGLPIPAATFKEALSDQSPSESRDSHLRSSGAVTGYHMEASDGEIGHVEGFVMDDETWAVRYLEVATKNWWPGKKVLVSPSWIQRVSWIDSKVYIGLSRDVVKNAPAYMESGSITRECKEQLHRHYGQPPYWLHQAEQKSAFSLAVCSPLWLDK